MPGHVFLSHGRSDRGVTFRVAQRLDAAGFDRLQEAVAHRAPPLEPMAWWREALVREPAIDCRRSDPR